MNHSSHVEEDEDEDKEALKEEIQEEEANETSPLTETKVSGFLAQSYAVARPLILLSWTIGLSDISHDNLSALPWHIYVYMAEAWCPWTLV